MKTVVISSIKSSEVGGMFTNFSISLVAPLCSCYPMVTMDVFYGNRCDSMVVRCRFPERGEGGVLVIPETYPLTAMLEHGAWSAGLVSW